jgi:site-specific recombinase XerC
MTALATTLQAFFTDRLARQRQVSPNTLAAYRDTLRLLLVFAANKKDKVSITTVSDGEIRDCSCFLCQEN